MSTACAEKLWAILRLGPSATLGLPLTIPLTAGETCRPSDRVDVDGIDAAHYASIGDRLAVDGVTAVRSCAPGTCHRITAATENAAMNPIDIRSPVPALAIATDSKSVSGDLLTALLGIPRWLVLSARLPL